MAKSKQHPRGAAASSQCLQGLRSLADLASALASLEDPESLQREALSHALEMLRCSSGAICLLDAESGHIRLGQAAGRAKGFVPRQLLDIAPVREVVLNARRPLVLADPGLTLGSALGQWSGLAVVPISGSRSVLGLVVLGDLAEGDSFSEADVALMTALGNVVAVAAETSLVHAAFRQEMGRRMTEAMAELSRASAELQRLKTFNEELFESVPVGIVVFDREFRVTFRNSAADRLWPEERSIVAAARGTDVARIDPEWEQGLREVINMCRPWLAEEVVRPRPGQEPLRLNLSCSPLVSAKGEVAGGVLIVEDVTSRVRMAERLAVSERLAGVGRLAAMVAHEINNPLDGILRLVSLARRVGPETGDERIEKYLAEVHKGLMRMGTIVRDLLDFSRSAAGGVEPMPIREILSEAARSMQPAAEKGGVTVEVACDAEVPALKSGSLYQVVVNLVKNAVEATPQGGKVCVSGRCSRDSLVIEVTDTGPGIPEEILPRLFEPFASSKALGKGTGLGLVISRDLVEKQGGTIVAANRPEGGAVFTVRVPLAPGACGRPGKEDA